MTIELEVVEREPVELTTNAVIPAPVVGGVPPETIRAWDAETLTAANEYTDAAVAALPGSGISKAYVDAADGALGERIDALPTPDVDRAYVDAADTALGERIDNMPAADVDKAYVDAQDQAIRDQVDAIPAPSWGDLADKPGTFPPSAHTHTVSQITDMPATPTWGTLGGKPTTFPPSAHQHAASDITSGVFAPARLGIGTASASTVLYGDGEWKSAPTGGGSGGGFPMPQAPAGHSDVVVPPWSTATTRSVGGTIVQPLVMASSRVYDRFAIRAVGAAAGVTVLLQLWRLEGTMWRYMPIGTFDLSSAGFKEITGRWVLPAGQYMYGAYTASNTGNWVAGAPYFGGPLTQGGTWPPSDARQSIWWANASQPVTVDLPGLDQVSLTSVGVINSPNSWGGGHLPALWARTAV